jgi:hypothetical protein
MKPISFTSLAWRPSSWADPDLFLSIAFWRIAQVERRQLQARLSEKWYTTPVRKFPLVGGKSRQFGLS